MLPWKDVTLMFRRLTMTGWLTGELLLEQEVDLANEFSPRYNAVSLHAVVIPWDDQTCCLRFRGVQRKAFSSIFKHIPFLSPILSSFFLSAFSRIVPALIRLV